MGNSPNSRPQFKFCTQCGTDKLEQPSRHEFVCASCGFRHFINPIAAVVGIISDSSGEVLMVRRASNPGKGLLGLPGGFVDIEETGEEALRREILEEVNLRIPDLVYFLSLPNRYHFQGIATPVLDYFYTAQVDTFDEATAQEEIAALEPVNLHRLDFDQIAFASNRLALERFSTIRNS